MNRIRKLREEKRMTQLRLSFELDVTQESICSYETGRNYPTVANLMKLSEIFGASCDYILGLSDVRTIMNGVKTDSDIEIVSMYNSLTPMEQNQVKAYMQALIDRKAFSDSNE